ncbi:hypothetical protein A176_001103 [Myxococcus hansupus]|uniref:Uncharacterized protein n=1 Tax=Pseudomyxococcus hansupus TaxID=1297742 RepID=A0A0H4WLD4_9BACT|nr:hypothetical protein A176_001103 [Myxococcus hansupus]
MRGLLAFGGRKTAIPRALTGLGCPHGERQGSPVIAHQGPGAEEHGNGCDAAEETRHLVHPSWDAVRHPGCGVKP